MKKIIVLISLLFSFTAFSGVIKKSFTVTKLRYNSDKKYYDVDFLNQAGIYKADEKWFKCLQQSLEKKLAAKVEFNPMGLKISNCEMASSK